MLSARQERAQKINDFIIIISCVKINNASKTFTKGFCEIDKCQYLKMVIEAKFWFHVKVLEGGNSKSNHSLRIIFKWGIFEIQTEIN